MEVVMKRVVFMAVLIFIIFFTTLLYAERIKDIAFIEGFRENQLVGYGLVVGLNGTGDKGDATLQSIANMLTRMGLRVNAKDIKAKDVASVMVTATLPPFPRAGSRIDVIVSAIGDAKNLQGGTLLMTPLKGPDGRVYAMAQGPVSIGGFQAGGTGATTQKNHPTVGRVPNGAIVERGIEIPLNLQREIKLILNSPDFTVASNMTEEINKALNGKYAKAVDPSTVILKVPDEYQGNVVSLMTLVEAIDVKTDMPARVVINERTGTVVIGSNVKIAPVAIAHGGLTIEISTQYGVSQPESFSKGETVIVPQTEVKAKEKEAHLIEVSGTTLGEVVRALNAMGVTPRDLIAILQALKESGALKADLEIL
ncbi:MAG: flagellar basal body P-ring protein FlgI [Nitrospirae bacterium]|nr:flagellar basal body P-ring protein FlgI [Nitrospirota bacterium]